MRGVRLSLSFQPSSLRRALALALMIAAPAELGSETLTLITTYPAPSGIYQRIVTTGAGATNNNTVLNRNGGSVELVPGSNTASGARLCVGAGSCTGASGNKVEIDGGDLAFIGTARRIVNVAAPTGSNDAVNKAYVDALGPGNWTCRVAASAVTTAATTSIACAGSEKLISGGCEVTSASVIWGSHPLNSTPSGWFCRQSAAASLQAFAYCCTTP